MGQKIHCGLFDLIQTAGVIGMDPATGKLKESLEDQVEQALTNLTGLLEDNNSDLKSVTKVSLYILVSPIHLKSPSHPSPIVNERLRQSEHSLRQVLH